MNTPTPRTDAATYPADCLGQTLVTNRDCPCALERELTAITAERDQLFRDYEYDHKCLHEVRERCESWKQRAKRAEAELDGIRALADRRNKRYHVEDTTHQLVAALDQALDIAQAELATERARLDSGQIMLTVAGERVWHCGVDLRAAIDAAMKEDAK